MAGCWVGRFARHEQSELHGYGRADELFRTLGVLYEEPSRKLSILFEESAESEGSWLATSDVTHWQTGAPVTEPERQQVFAHLNEWGSARGWTFDFGVSLLDLRLDDVPPERRAFIQMLLDAARQQAEERKKIYEQ